MLILNQLEFYFLEALKILQKVLPKFDIDNGFSDIYYEKLYK